MGIFHHKQILEVHMAAVAAGLGDHRGALLAGIAREVLAALPSASSPNAQLLVDIDALNELETLVDASIPLAVWLANAASLTPLRKEAAVFVDALERTQSTSPGHAATDLRDAATPAQGSRLRASATRSQLLRGLAVGLITLATVVIVAQAIAHHPSTAKQSYRGLLRHMDTGQPLAEANVSLIGTTCSTVTKDDGVFDFVDCRDEGIMRLKHPKIAVGFRRSNDNMYWDCQDIPLRSLPDMTQIRLDPQACVQRPPVTIQLYPIPPHRTIPPIQPPRLPSTRTTVIRREPSIAVVSRSIGRSAAPELMCRP
jgi:hypothetical protein